MKKIIPILVMVIIFGLTACIPDANEIREEKIRTGFQGKTIQQTLPDQCNEYTIIVIDSCEYIYTWFGQGNGGGSLTHKGNCKFCEKRHNYNI